MSGQYGGQLGVEPGDTGGNYIGEHLLHLLVNLAEVKIFGLFLTEQGAPSQPGQGDYLQGAAFGGDAVNIGAAGDVYLLDRQGVEDFHRRRPATG